MTLDDLERQNRCFYGFFDDFWLRHFKSERTNCAVITKHKPGKPAYLTFNIKRSFH